MDVTTAIAKLTKLGRPVMEAIGNRETSFFDNGIEEGSGIWGDNLAGELGAKPGTLTGLVKQGLLTSDGEQDPTGGAWYALTALGAAVAQALAAPEAAEEPAPAPVTPEPAPAPEQPARTADAVVQWRGNYNTVFAPAAELFGRDAWTVNVTAMLKETQIAGADAKEFAATLTQLEMDANAALRDWQKTQKRDGQSDMEKFNQNRSFLAGYCQQAARSKTPVVFARDMEKALRPEARKAGSAARKNA